MFHDRMLLTVRAVTRPEYDAWLASQQAPPVSRRVGVSGSAAARAHRDNREHDAMTARAAASDRASPLGPPASRSAA